MKIIVIRHGETEDNRKGALYGQADRGLSNIGKTQAQKAALILANEPIDVIYSSDLQRCIETAKFIKECHPKVPLHSTSLLREIHGGRVSKLPLRLPPRLLTQAVRLALLLNIKVPGGESWQQVKSRVKSFLNELHTIHPNDTVLLVTHNVTIQAIRALLKTAEDKDIKGGAIDNCGVLYFTMQKQINC